jgi:hypothetical protein
MDSSNSSTAMGNNKVAISKVGMSSKAAISKAATSKEVAIRAATSSRVIREVVVMVDTERENL